MKKFFSRWLQDAWYQEKYILPLLIPFSLLYENIVRFRFYLFKTGVLKKTKMPVPIIIIGNITVGGTGKTPLILYLASFFRKEGYKPGIISRGYGGNSKTWPQWVDAQSQAKYVGDEAVLMAKKADCPLVVGPNRVKAAQMLLDKTSCNIILSDDGLQHYALERDIEIAVVDGERGFGNGHTLPCGPLREPLARIQKVDLVIINGEIESANNWATHGSIAEIIEFTMAISGKIAANLLTKEEKSLNHFSKALCHAVAGIGNPNRFFKLLEGENINLQTHAFPDHHQFTLEDITFEDDQPILMTEKDAVKCIDFAQNKHWYVPIKAIPQQQFLDKLLRSVREIT